MGIQKYINGYPNIYKLVSKNIYKCKFASSPDGHANAGLPTGKPGFANWQTQVFRYQSVTKV